MLVQNCSATEKAKIPHVSVRLWWDDESMFISSQSQELHLKFVKQMGEVERECGLREMQGSSICDLQVKSLL